MRILEFGVSNEYVNKIKLKSGGKYLVYIYFDDSIFRKYGSGTSSSDKRIRAFFPRTIDSMKKYVLRSDFLSLEDKPILIAGGYISSDEILQLEYLQNSLKLYSITEKESFKLNSDEFFSDGGIKIQDDYVTHDKKTPDKGEASGYITFCLIAKNV